MTHVSIHERMHYDRLANARLQLIKLKANVSKKTNYEFGDIPLLISDLDTQLETAKAELKQYRDFFKQLDSFLPNHFKKYK